MKNDENKAARRRTGVDIILTPGYAAPGGGGRVVSTIADKAVGGKKKGNGDLREKPWREDKCPNVPHIQGKTSF